jgi:hypothetical protein
VDNLVPEDAGEITMRTMSFGVSAPKSPVLEAHFEFSSSPKNGLRLWNKERIHRALRSGISALEESQFEGFLLSGDRARCMP